MRTQRLRKSHCAAEYQDESRERNLCSCFLLEKSFLAIAHFLPFRMFFRKENILCLDVIELILFREELAFIKEIVATDYT